MDYSDALARIEDACARLQQPPHRAEAEQTLLAFRRSANVIPVCRFILDRTRTPAVQFQVGIALREAAMREFSLLSEGEVDELKSYLLNYIYSRPTMENFVRETLISCINVLIKRSWLEDTEERRQAILHRITELLNTDLFGKRLSLMLLNGLVSEFSSEKSAQVGLTWDFHNRCKAAFEKSELRHVFDIALQVLRAALDSRDWWANAPDGQVLVNAALAALSSCLSWDFAKDDTCLKTTFAKRGEEYEDVMTTPDFPETWRDVLVRPDVLDTFFLAYVRFQDNVGYLSKCEECLIQLAGLRGRVFSDEASRKAYADHFMKGMTAILTNYPLVAKNTDPDDLGSIALALATIIRRFFSVYKISMLHDLPGFLPFLEQAGALSEATLHGMLEPTDDPFFEDAFEDLLCAWSALVTETLALHNPNPLNANNAPAFDAAGFLSVLRNVSGNLFARYLETRLQIVQNNIEDDIYESEVKDYIMYNDQLLMLSQLARLDAQRNIAKLHGVLVDRLERLGRWLAAPTQDEGYLSAIHEHMHWLILIAAFLLADTGMSEKPLLDENLVLLAASENGQSALVPGMDSIGALTKAVLDILDYVSVPTTDPRAPDLSPMVAESGMFFVARWVLTYLFIDSSDYKALPATLVAAYGRPEHGGRGPAVLDQILDLIGRNFRLWSTETDVLVQAIAALESFSKNKFLENATLSTPRFRDLVAYFLDSLATLPEDTHALLIETVARIVSGAPDENLRSAYLGSLGQAIDKRLQQVLGRPDFQAVYQQPEVLSDIDSVLEMFTGLALASDPTNSKQIFSFCSGYLPSFVKLFSIYANRAEVLVVILSFYEAFVRNQDFEQLGPEDKQVIYNSVIEILKIYAAHNTGRRAAVSKDAEDDDAYRDLSAMLEILTNMMAAEFHGMAKDELSNRKSAKATPGTVDVADVVFYGVNIVLPLITDEMLRYPRLCRLYTHLASDLLEFFPEKLATLPPELLASLLKTLNFGIESHWAEVAETTFAAITALAIYVKYVAEPGSVSFLEPHLDALLQSVLKLVFFNDFNTDLVPTAAEAVLALALCRQATYSAYLSNLIGSQGQPSQSRLVAAFGKLGTAMENALLRANPGDASGGLGIPNKVFNEYLRVFEAVLSEARGLLRVR